MQAFRDFTANFVNNKFPDFYYRLVNGAQLHALNKKEPTEENPNPDVRPVAVMDTTRSHGHAR